MGVADWLNRGRAVLLVGISLSLLFVSNRGKLE